jgi:hypothetical protein
VKAAAELPGLLAAGCKVQVHGWKRQGSRWRVKILEVLAENLQAVVVCPLPARRAARHRLGTLFAGG